MALKLRFDFRADLGRHEVKRNGLAFLVNHGQGNLDFIDRLPAAFGGQVCLKRKI